MLPGPVVAAVSDRRLEFLHFDRANRNHPGTSAPPLLNQERSSFKLPSSDEEGQRLWRGVVLNRKCRNSRGGSLRPPPSIGDRRYNLCPYVYYSAFSTVSSNTR